MPASDSDSQKVISKSKKLKSKSKNIKKSRNEKVKKSKNKGHDGGKRKDDKYEHIRQYFDEQADQSDVDSDI